jgi:nucleoside-diphosphate-sugar epimerase
LVQPLFIKSGKPLKESGLDLNDDPATPYFGIGWSGRFVEKMCADWHRDTGNDMIMVRSANVYGPYAKFDPRTSNFIPALIRKAVARMEPFRVWGDPGVKRDVIFADDFAGAIVALLNSTRIKMDCFNVGSGSAISVRSAVNAVLKGAGYMPKRIVYGQKAPVTVKGRVLDISRITKLTGWRPGVSLDKGVAITVEWWRDNKGWWKK